MKILMKLNKWIEILLIGTITIILIVFLYDFHSILTKSVRNEADRNLLQAANISAIMIHEKIDSDLNTVYSISKSLSIYDAIDDDLAKNMIHEVGLELPFSIVVVSDLDGNYYTNSGGLINLSEPHYLIGSTGSSKSIAVIYKNALYGRDMISLEAPVYKDGELIGKISGLYYTNYISNILYHSRDLNEMDYQIVERNGQFLLKSGFTIFQGYDTIYDLLDKVEYSKFSHPNDYLYHFVNRQPGVSSFQYQNQAYDMCYIPIMINDWYLIVAAKQNGINLQELSIENPLIILTIRIVLLFILLICYIVWKQFRYRVSMERNKIELELLNDKLEQNNQTLRIKAENDLLTGLYNKITSELLIADYLATDGKHGRHALMIIDIDDFKHINDAFGHYYGDRALSEVANGIDHHLRTTDLKGRVGGDEFIILLKNIFSDEALLQKAEEIQSVFKEIDMENNKVLKISGSIGIAIYPDHGYQYSDLYRKADKAMYHSKQTGKNHFTIYHREIEN